MKKNCIVNSNCTYVHAQFGILVIISNKLDVKSTIMSDLLFISEVLCHNTLWLVIVPICERTGMSSKWVNDTGKGQDQ